MTAKDFLRTIVGDDPGPPAEPESWGQLAPMMAESDPRESGDGRHPLDDPQDDGDDLEVIDPDQVGTCKSCGRYNDTQLLDGLWVCSQCDPKAPARRELTLRHLAAVEAIKKRLGENPAAKSST